MGRMEVKCGIRQGCTGSPQLFVMVVGMLIERMIKSGVGYERGMIRIPVLFYADDGLIFARSRTEAEGMLKLMEGCGMDYGLEINRDKSVFMVFNESERVDGMVGGVRMVERMRYLGVDVTAGRDCYAENRKRKIELAERMANVTFSVIARACERMMIGKVYWKSVVLPSVLSASEVTVWKASERKRLQRIENGV